MNDPDSIRTAVLFIWLLAEPIRLWTGYSGNLRENVSTGGPLGSPLCPHRHPKLTPTHAHALSLSTFFACLLVVSQVPILLVFWLLTFFVSTPVAIYMAFAQTDIQPYDKGINMTVVVLLVLELIAGVYAVSLPLTSPLSLIQCTSPGQRMPLGRSGTTAKEAAHDGGRRKIQAKHERKQD